MIGKTFKVFAKVKSVEKVTPKAVFNPEIMDTDVAYWKSRCEAAERYISESPCDPDITSDQIEAYAAWQELVEQEN